MSRLRTIVFGLLACLLFVGGSFSQQAVQPRAGDDAKDGVGKIKVLQKKYDEAVVGLEAAYESLKRLKEGNDRFTQGRLMAKNIGTERRAELKKGQHPFATVLACADSRVAPELLFDQGLGELFVLRVAGNITDPFILGSIEYAVEHLHTPLIVVLGHENCGAVAAALTGVDFPGNLGKLIKEVRIGKDLPMERAAALPLAVQNNVVFHEAQMTLRSPLLREEVAHKKVKIVSGVYKLESGKVDWLEGK